MSHGNKSYQDTYYHPGGGGTHFITFYIWKKYSLLLMNFLSWISANCFDFSPLSSYPFVHEMHLLISISILEENTCKCIRLMIVLLFGSSPQKLCGVANVIVVIVHCVDSGCLSDHHQLHYRSQVTKKCSNILGTDHI